MVSKKNLKIRCYAKILLIIIHISVFKSFEMNLILPEASLLIFKSNKINEKDAVFKNNLFDYDENNLCESSLSTSCPFNRLFYESSLSNQTQIEINFIFLPIFEELAKEKKINQTFTDSSEIEFFRIENITNNLDSISAAYKIHYQKEKEFTIVYKTGQDRFYLKDIFIKNKTSSYFEFENLSENHPISVLKNINKKNLNSEADYENVIEIINFNIKKYNYEKKNNKTHSNLHGEEETIAESNSDSQDKLIKIQVKSYILSIFHFCHCSNSKITEKISSIGEDFNEPLKFVENRQIKSISTKWSNLKINFSYKSFNLADSEYKTSSIQTLSFIKICDEESILKVLLPAMALICLAYFTTYYSTNNKINISIIKDLKQVDEIKWWHGFFFLIFASLFLIIIFYFLIYVSFFYTFLVALNCGMCSFYTLNYLFKSKFIKGDENFENSKFPIKSKISNNLENFADEDNTHKINNLINLCQCKYKASKKIKNINVLDEDYKHIDKKMENQFDPDFVNKEKNELGDIGLDIQENFKGVPNDIINVKEQEKQICRDCNGIIEDKLNNSSELKVKKNSLYAGGNFNYMNPIYNYRNNKSLVILNKKIVNFITTKNPNSYFYHEVKLRIYEMINIVIVIIALYFWYTTRNWILNNLFVFTLSFVALSIFTIRNFKICIILLLCIFFYDVFWVFFSKQIFKKNVMVEVAISLNVPIKFEFPILFSYNPLHSCMLLGLGDIVLPGIIIKYCKNFDYLKIHNKLQNINYYILSLRLYLLSVIAAFLMNFIFNHAQPVLFYIAPIFIIGLILNAVRNGELKDFVNGENYRITQMCVDEIINTEFSKFEDGHVWNREYKMDQTNEIDKFKKDKNLKMNDFNNDKSIKNHKNFVVLDEN